MAAKESARPEVAVESVGLQGARPHGKRFGTLVHTLLSLVDLAADRAAVQAVAGLQGRLLGASAEEIAAATQLVAETLTHPLLRRAASAWHAGRCRRETPVSLRLEDGQIVAGVVDLAFLETAERALWTIVDFKTDLELAGRLDEYRQQVGLYAQAIARATGSETRAILLRL